MERRPTHDLEEGRVASDPMSRREILMRALGAAALLAGGRRSAFPGTPPARPVPAVPDRHAGAPSRPVAIRRCPSYEPRLLRRELEAALDGIGGIETLVRGKTVTVKLNMTGPARPVGGLPASRTYHIHPNVAGALCAALRDAGARRIVLAEALYAREPVEEILIRAGWDLKAIRAAGGHDVVLENTKNRGRWPGYSRLKVPWGGYLFPAFDVNRWFATTDVLVSLAKLKEHGVSGVTAACKNLFGILPTALYGDDAPNEESVRARVALLHNARRSVPEGVPGEWDRGIPREAGYRVPRVVADVVAARPVDLSVVDGIDTMRGGEGYWIRGVEPIQPKLLLVGRNPVCTDAVCSAVMGWDPASPHGKPPFPGENHLRLLAAVGAGTNEIDRIEVVGLPLREAIHPFRPAARAGGAVPRPRAGGRRPGAHRLAIPGAVA